MNCLRIKMFGSYQNEREYICKVIFNEFLGLEFVIDWVSQRTDNYRIECQGQYVEFPDVLFSTPLHDWLRSTSFPILPLQRIDSPPNSFRAQVPVLYGVSRPTQELSIADIDILGSIFFMLTRYEEIGDHPRDEFGRYHHKNSILFLENLLDRPLVNEYLDLLKYRLKKVAPSIEFKRHTYQVSVSHDVDVPITFNASWKDCFIKSIGDLYYRRSLGLFLKRYFGKVYHLFTNSFEYDPNNNFDFIMNEEKRVGIRGLFNFIPIPGQRPLDSNYNLANPAIQKLLRTIAKRNFEIGFHPGYDSFENLEQTKKELDELNGSLKRLGLPSVTKGRHHYLRWSNPMTWRIWNEIGLKEDGSVGYGMTNGFRSGCCYKYSVFDLERREHLSLIEEPLIFMDVNCNVNSDSLLEDVLYYHETCKVFDGNFTVLYHNNYIISRKQKRLFKRILAALAS